jgi:hypothetical protein
VTQLCSVVLSGANCNGRPQLSYCLRYACISISGTHYAEVVGSSPTLATNLFLLAVQGGRLPARSRGSASAGHWAGAVRPLGLTLSELAEWVDIEFLTKTRYNPASVRVLARRRRISYAPVPQTVVA